MAKKNKSRKGARVLLSIMCVLLAIVLTLMVGATVLAEVTLTNMNYVEKGQSVTMSQEEAEALKEQLASEAAEKATENSEEATTEYTGVVLSEDDVDLEVEVTTDREEEDNVVNILMVGQDTRNGERERSDTMMLITVNQNKNTITVTSFMRDMYVKIPGFYKHKINTAYALGGMDLLNETLYQNFGIVVDGNVEVSFGQFTEIINYLGGIDVELTDDEANFVNKAMGAGATPIYGGMNHLNGDRALAYARYRDKATGDFGRTERQRKTLNAIIEEYKSSDLTTMIGMVNEIMGMITTNLTKTEILNYAVKYFPMLATADLVSQRVPFDGEHTNGKTYYYMAMIDEMSVVVPRLEENMAKLAETLS